VVEAQEGDGLAGLGRGGAERHDRGAEGEGGGTEADGRPTGDAADVEDGHGTGSWTRGEGDGEDSRGSERARVRQVITPHPGRVGPRFRESGTEPSSSVHPAETPFQHPWPALYGAPIQLLLQLSGGPAATRSLPEV